MGERGARVRLDALQADADALAAERVPGEARFEDVPEPARDSGVVEVCRSTSL